MTKLYIANTTNQNKEFLYKIPSIDAEKNFRVVIPAGGQALIYQDAEHQLLMRVIDQHLMYGLVPVSQIDRTKHFIGMCYQFDQPIDVEKIQYALAHNEAETERQSHEIRKQSAAALSGTIDQVMMGSEQKLASLEVEMLEQPKSASDTDEKRIETIQVAKPGSKAAQRGANKAQ
jgi:hypothetical protein